MKKLILTGLSFLFAITLTFAQEINPETKAKEDVTALTQKLNLTEDQQKSIHTIVLEKYTAKQALMADTTQAPDAVKAQLDAIKNTSIAKIAEQLDETQKVEFAKHIEEKMKAKEENKEEPKK